MIIFHVVSRKQQHSPSLLYESMEAPRRMEGFRVLFVFNKIYFPGEGSLPHRTCEQYCITGILADASYRVGPPVAAKGYIYPHLFSALGERPSDIGAYSQQHLEFVLSLLPSSIRSSVKREPVNLVVVGGNDGIEAVSAGFNREHLPYQLIVVGFDAGM